MPNKYSHALVLSQQQYRSMVNNNNNNSNNTDSPQSLRSPSSLQSPTHAYSPASSLSSLSDYSSSGSLNTETKPLEPVRESAPSPTHRSSTYTAHSSFDFTIPDAPRFDPKSPERSRPPSSRLRLESPFGFRLDIPPSPPPKPEPQVSERPYDEISSSHHHSASPSLARLRLGDTSPHGSRSPRPSLHHKSSSIETQIYDPEPTASSPPTQEGQDVFSLEPYGGNAPHPAKNERLYYSPPTVHERQNYSSRPSLEIRHRTSPIITQNHQHVSSKESSESSLLPIPSEDHQEHILSETQRAYLSSPTRDRRRSFIQETQDLASPGSIQARSAQSPSATPNPPLFSSSTRDLQDYISKKMLGSHSVRTSTKDRKDVSTVKASSALPSSLQNNQVRPSLDMQRLHSPRQSHEHQRRPTLDTQTLHSPRQSQEHQRRPSLGMQNFSFERRPGVLQGSVHSRKQSIDSLTTKERQERPSLGARNFSSEHSSEQSIKETQRSRGQSVNSKTAQERQHFPPWSSHQLLVDPIIQELGHSREPSNNSQIYTSQPSSSFTERPKSRQTPLGDAQRHTPKNSSHDNGLKSSRDRPSELADTFAPQHKRPPSTDQGAYDNISIETHGFPPERPPSPPATPDMSKKISLTPLQESQRTRSPPPIPHRSAWRSPSRQRSMLRSTGSLADNLLSSEPSRPKTSSSIDTQANSKKATALHSPTFSISTRGSSINAITSVPPAPFSTFSDTMKFPPRKSSIQSRDGEYFNDADLAPLPAIVDYSVLPFENPNAGPAIFRTTQLGLEAPVSPRHDDPGVGPAFFRTTSLGRSVSRNRSVSSRASSYDSAAPPPIGLNRRITHAVDQSEVPKKEGKKSSLLSFLRSTPAPKAILYSEATQGKPPSLASSKKRYQGRKSGDSRMRPGLLPKTSNSSRSAAHLEAAEKRKSWIKNEEVNKSLAASRARAEKQREFERILSRI